MTVGMCVCVCVSNIAVRPRYLLGSHLHLATGPPSSTAYAAASLRRTRATALRCPAALRAHVLHPGLSLAHAGA